MNPEIPTLLSHLAEIHHFLLCFDCAEQFNVCLAQTSPNQFPGVYLPEEKRRRCWRVVLMAHVKKFALCGKEPSTVEPEDECKSDPDSMFP